MPSLPCFELQHEENNVPATISFSKPTVFQLLLSVFFCGTGAFTADAPPSVAEKNSAEMAPVHAVLAGLSDRQVRRMLIDELKKENVVMNRSFLRLSFYGDTFDLLRTPPDKGRVFIYPLSRRASVKDIIEGLGVPHTEVGAIVLGRQQQTFDVIPSNGDHFHIHPLSSASLPIFSSPLRPEPLPAYAFMVDSNVNRLCQLLRMTGFDACSAPMISGAALARQTVRQQRILLSRNHELLKLRTVVHGRLVRSQEPYRQLAEIIDLYQLRTVARPFSRCMRCNGLLHRVTKEEILERLLPLTRKYYTRFKRCSDCEQIYWRGSHHFNMMEKITPLLG